ncbi:MAG: PDZ domain-containing protein [Dehalococcoidales bacterium]|nr:PDZ domain-containing protein [Dehalococcoidales bacterium]
MDVKIYTTPTCGYCHQAMSFLDELGVPYKEHDVSRDRAAAEEMVRLTGQMGVPVIVIDNQPVIGFDRNRIRQLLASGNGSKKSVRFGLKIADALKVAPQMGLAPTPGVIIGGVTPGLLGEKAGLKPGDIVTGLNGGSIKSAADMEKFLAAVKQGNIITINFLRDGKTRKSEIVV